MKQTEHYNLDLYEPNDLANLTDGYNNSMQILDTGMQALKDLTESYDERITTADTTANNALSLAQTNEKDIATLDSEMAGTAESGLKTLIETKSKVNSDAIEAEFSRASAAEKANADAISVVNNKIENAVYATDNIYNANIAWQNIYDSDLSMQGCTPFSASNDYYYDANNLYMACVFTGAADDKDAKLNIYDKNGTLVSSLAIGDGHFGSISFNGSNKLYTLNYTTGTVNYGKLFEIDISNVNTPYISKIYNTDGKAYTYNFWHNDKMCVGYASPVNVIHLFDWDLESNTYTQLNDLVFPNYNNRMHVTQHITYDAYKDYFILTGYSPNGICIYDSECNFIKSIGISEVLNSTRVGEIESFVSINGNFWFSSSDISYNYGVTQKRAKYFHYNVNENVLLTRRQFSNNSNCNVDFTAASSRNDTYINNIPYFKFFDDAINYAKSFPGSMYTTINVTDYPYVCACSDYHGSITVTASNCTGIALVNCSGTISCKLNNAGELVASDNKSFMYLRNCQLYLDIVFDVELGELDNFIYANNCHLNARNPSNMKLITSTLNAGNMSSCQLEAHSIAFVLSQKDSTYSSSGYVIMNTN